MKLKPYLILGINSAGEARSKFISLLRDKNTSKEKKKKYCLAFDMICIPSKYNIKNGYYKPIILDEFYYTNIGDLENLRYLIKSKKDRSVVNSVDKLGRSLLYLASRNGYDDIVEYLIKIGADINQIQRNGSTPLHGASFYGQKSTVKLLIERGCNPYLFNFYGNHADTEAYTKTIKSLIYESFNDKILKLYHNLYSKNKVSNYVPIKKDGKIICIKLVCKNEYNSLNNEQYKVVWHGTKFKNLESIVINGLKPSGTKMSNGTIITPPSNHIALGETYDGFTNWAKAVFVSPSCIYSSLDVYAEKINSYQKKWACLLEGRVKNGAFTMHRATSQKRLIPGEPSLIEYRVVIPDDKYNDYHILYITSVVFISMDYLGNIESFKDTDKIVNTQNELMLTSGNYWVDNISEFGNSMTL